MLARRLFVVLLLALSLTIIAALSTTRLSRAINTLPQTSQQPLFQDNFNGSSIDFTKWNGSFATSGIRWCSSTVTNQIGAPGIWFDPSTTPCQGVSQNPPYGSVSVGGGLATFSSTGSHAFPYVWSGLPSKPSPFPTVGNFVLEVKMRYNSITGSGDGLLINKWNNTDPVGNNPPIGHPDIFQIWADSMGLRVKLLGNQTYSIYDEFGTHDYILEYLGGQYSVFVDGFHVLGPLASSERASAIWIGNPVFTWWSPPTGYDWSSFSLSQVQVGLPSLQLSPSTGPVGAKVIVQGTGISVPTVEITFDDNFIGTTSVSNSSFSFTLDVPLAQVGSHEIKAVDGIGDIIAAAPFVVSPNGPSSLVLSLSTGGVYFPGDTIVASLLVTSNGMPVAASSLQVSLNLTKPDNSSIALGLTPIGTGLFRASYALSRTTQIGTYSLLAMAKGRSIGSGSAITTFEVKLPWLSSQGSTLAVAGALSASALAIGLVSWRKGVFKRSRYNTNWNA